MTEAGGLTPLFELVPAPLPRIVWILLIACLMVGAGGTFAMVADGDSPILVIIAVAALASAPVWALRRQRMRVAAFPNHLVVHNGKRRYQLERSEIADFEIETAKFRDVRAEGGILAAAVHAVGYTGAKVPLQVTAEKVGRRPLSATLAQLQEWLASDGCLAATKSQAQGAVTARWRSREGGDGDDR